MSLLVQKYGGTSVADLSKIEAAARKVATSVTNGDSVAVVVSAMAGETDRLLQLAHDVSDSVTPREFAAIASSGELVTAGLMALTLSRIGVPAVSLSGAQAGIRTIGKHHKARIETVNADLPRNLINSGKVPVVAGFQGVNQEGETTTLGRGGSDTTAVALAAALQADECLIYTDVDGIFTCDPRIVSNARRLSSLHFEELLELASLGAKVLNVRAAEYAAKQRVPMRILSSMTDDPEGTLITYDENGTMEKPIVTGIALNRQEAKITLIDVPDRPGIASRILKEVADEEIDVDMIIQNIGSASETSFSFTVQRADYEHALDTVRKIAKELGSKGVTGDNAIGKLSVVGIGMKSHAGVASRMFEVLAAENINIQMISTSEIKISVVIEEKYLELAARALHAAFGLESEPLEERPVAGPKV